MSRYHRPRQEGACIYFHVALDPRHRDLLLRHMEALREAVRLTRAERPFEILAWVVLPNEMHCIWRLPAGDAGYGLRWRLIKARFSRALPMGPRRRSHVARGERGIWQRRFWEHHIRDASDLAAHMELCRQSPVAQGLVARPEDWRWSSLRDGRGRVRACHAPSDAASRGA